MRRALRLALLLIPGSMLTGASAAGQQRDDGETLRVNGFDMYYEAMGTGEPLLLVHGWSGNSEYFEPLLDALSAHYRLIIPELRGHGRSTNPSGTFTTEQAARDVLALLDHLGLEGVRALGASAGGLTLLHMALLDPAALGKMVLVGVGPHFPPHCKESMAAATADTYSPEWWRIMRARHPGGDEQIRELVAYLRGLAAAEGDVDFSPEKLSSVRSETLIVQGDQDWCFPPILAAEMHQAIPRASLWVIPEGEHVPILGSRAPLFLELALEFYQGETEVSAGGG